MFRAVNNGLAQDRVAVSAHPAISYPAFALGFVAEVGLGLWLLIKGAKVIDSGTGLPD